MLLLYVDIYLEILLNDILINQDDDAQVFLISYQLNVLCHETKNSSKLHDKSFFAYLWTYPFLLRDIMQFIASDFFVCNIK